jgi:hypothetical protein
MHWLTQPYIDLYYVAARLYGRGSRLHTRKLQDRLGGRFHFQRWELDRLEEIRAEMITGLGKGPMPYLSEPGDKRPLVFGSDAPKKVS